MTKRQQRSEASFRTHPHRRLQILAPCAGYLGSLQCLQRAFAIRQRNCRHSHGSGVPSAPAALAGQRLRAVSGSLAKALSVELRWTDKARAWGAVHRKLSGLEACVANGLKTYCNAQTALFRPFSPCLACVFHRPVRPVFLWALIQDPGRPRYRSHAWRSGPASNYLRRDCRQFLSMSGLHGQFASISLQQRGTDALDLQ
jgi:hypothetical protein